MTLRVTITIDKDVESVVQRLCESPGIGISEAINELSRRGIGGSHRAPFIQSTHDLGVKIDVASVAEALDLAEGTLRN